MTHKEEVRSLQVRYCNTVESLFKEDSIIEFDDLSIYELEDITEVAHILDEIQIGNFKILQNENN